MFVEKLVCQDCEKNHPSEKNLYVCKDCGGKLTIDYDYEKIRDNLSKDKIIQRNGGVWKYKELLPVNSEDYMITNGEGNTPLTEAGRLAEIIGVENLWLKNEIQNPTSSFKDRAMSVGVSKALEFGAKTVVTASSGNAATALASYSAKGDLECYAFVPEDAPEAKLAQISLHGANVVRASSTGTGDPSYELMKLGFENFDWHPVPSGGAFNPYQPEGNKTISYEICEQLDWEAPDWFIVPVGAGTLLSGSAKGFFEFQDMGFVKDSPRIVGVQAEGCAPLVEAYKENKKPAEIQTWENPKTCAGGLVDPYPWDADTAIPAIRKSNGTAISVSDGEILSALQLLARTEGIFAEPSGVTGLAGMIKLFEEGKIKETDKVVISITGSGLKDQKTAVQLAGEIPTIEPELKQLERIVN